MTHTDEEPELDPDFDQELDALVPEAWADPFDLAEPDLISFETFFRDEGREPVPESCRTDPLQEAAAELALAQKRLDAHFARFLVSLKDSELDRLHPHDQDLVRAFRALPEREQQALHARFSDPRFGVTRLQRTSGPSARRPYEPPALETLRRVESVERRTEALRRIARTNLGAIVTFERMLDDFDAHRASEPSSRRAAEPPSRGATEPPSRRAAEPRVHWPFEPKTAPPWPGGEASRDPVEVATAGARSCRWCKETVEDEFDHDFCEPRQPDDQMTHPELGGDYRATELRYQEDVRCACCDCRVAVVLVAPPAAAERGMSSATTVLCPYGSSISLAYSWKRQRVVALRMTPPAGRELH